MSVEVRVIEGDDNVIVIPNAVCGAALDKDGQLALAVFTGGKHLIFPISEDQAKELIKNLTEKLTENMRLSS